MSMWTWAIVLEGGPEDRPEPGLDPFRSPAGVERFELAVEGAQLERDVASRRPGPEIAVDDRGARATWRLARESGDQIEVGPLVGFGPRAR